MSTLIATVLTTRRYLALFAVLGSPVLYAQTTTDPADQPTTANDSQQTVVEEQARQYLLDKPAVADEPSNDSEQTAFEERVRQYLLDNPEVIIEAIQRYQAEQREAALASIRNTIQDNADDLFHSAADAVVGNPDGSVTLVEFMDYNCGFCRRASPMIREVIAQHPQVRLVYKEFPILGPSSEFAARAALAARRQDGYLPFHDALMAQEGRLENPQILELAADTGLDVAQLEVDMDNPAITATIQENYALAESLGITGTPSYVIGDQVLGGVPESAQLSQLIQDATPSEE